MTPDTILARRYYSNECHELIRSGSTGRYHIAINGSVNARRVERLADAQEFYDYAPYQIGARPESAPETISAGQ